MSGALPGLRRLFGLLPLLLIFGGVAADLYGPEPYTGLPLLAAAPLLACAVTTFRSALAITLVACIATVTVDLVLGRPAMALAVDVADVLLISSIGLWLRKVLAQRDRSLTRSRDIAEAAQVAILPRPPARVGPLLFATKYKGAQEEASIGGDFYAVKETRYGVRVIVGDVRGKGLSAVSTMSAVVSAFRVLADQAPTLDRLARQLDSAAEQVTVGDYAFSENFTTALFAEFSQDDDRVHLLSRGHPSPLLVHGGRIDRLRATAAGPPLGAGITVSGPAAPETYHLPAGAALLITTDGVTEARNARGDFYDPEIGLAGRCFNGPEDLVDAVVSDVDDWSGGLREDDMAVLAVQRLAVA